VAVVITAFTAVMAASLYVTSTTWFCDSCHIHDADIANYRTSAHSDVNCEQCHSKPGPFFFLTAKLEALQQPVKQLVGNYEEPILGAVQNAACRRCHTNDELFTTISKSGINIQHEHLIAAGYLCITCHATVAHGEAVPQGSRTYPTMDQCLVCHNNHYRDADGAVATSRCDQCHTQPGYGARPANHTTDWIDIHGSAGILSTCTACHPKVAPPRHAASPIGPVGDCVDCHGGVLMPHPDDWMKRHGGVEETLGRTTCLQCHKSPTYCYGCHKVKLPHPADWFGQHAVAAARAEGTCFNCHDQSNCQACHAAHQVGTPQAHGFLKGAIKQWTPPPAPATPSPAYSPAASPVEP
jgi:nitrate/TMAO reductase-like tetraheme cytochrome c subunit